MKDILNYILQNSLPEGTEFEVKQTEDEIGITFELQIEEESRGKIIGKGGRNIQAIRDLLNVVARRHQKRVYLKVLE